VANLGREVKKSLVEACKKVDEEFLRKATEAKPTWKVCLMILSSQLRLIFCIYETVATIHWTGLLDWTSGLDRWTDL
jgi:hypothetical protein